MTCGCDTSPHPVPRTPAEHRAIAMRHRKKPSRPMNAGLPSRQGGPVYFTETPTRHLTMHIWPTAWSDAWEWNVDQVIQRIEQFNGRRVIGIVTGDGAVNPDAVKERFKGHGCDFIVAPNVKNIGEVVTAPDMFRRVLRSNPNDLVFYCHAKGVKYKTKDADSRTVRRWAEVMYRTLLDDPQSVSSALVNHTFAASFRRKYGTQNSAWHFSGTYFWFRSAFVGSNAISKIARRYTGVEFWPPRICGWNDSACLFHDNAKNLYSPSYWTTSVEPDAVEWESHQNTASVVVPCRNYGRYLGECLDSIAGQTVQPSEILVVDDGSTDNTKAVADERRVKYVRIDARDPHEARRTGFAATSGKYVCFVDADDVIPPDYLATAVSAMQRSDATIAYSDLQHFGDDDKLVGLDEVDIRRANYIHGGAVCRRDALKASGVMDSRLPDASNRYSDWWLWRNALRCGGSTVKHGSVYRYRKHAGSLSKRRSDIPESYKHCHDLLRVVD